MCSFIHLSAQNQGPKPRFLVFCALGGAQGIKTPKTLVPSFFWFQKRKIATKGVFRARICVSTPELAMVFRGESVSGHPGARGGQNNLDNRPEKVPKSPKTQKQKKQSRPEFRRKTVGEKHKTQRKKQKYAAQKGPQTRAFHLGSCWASRCPLAALLGPVAAFLVPF